MHALAASCEELRARTGNPPLVPEDVEAVCLEIIKPKSKPVLIASAYRPPNSQIEFLDKVEVLFQNLDNEHKELIIVGDLNCDFLSNNLN